jgi:hypothetical protein
LPEHPEYVIDIQYTLRVNTIRKPGDVEHTKRCFFFLSLIEDKVMALINNLASTINGREYT